MERLKLQFMPTREGRIEIHFEEPFEKLSMSLVEAQQFLAVLKQVERMAYDALMNDASDRGSESEDSMA